MFSYLFCHLQSANFKSIITGFFLFLVILSVLLHVFLQLFYEPYQFKVVNLPGELNSLSLYSLSLLKLYVLKFIFFDMNIAISFFWSVFVYFLYLLTFNLPVHLIFTCDSNNLQVLDTVYSDCNLLIKTVCLHCNL